MKNGIWALIIIAFTLTAFVGGYMANGGYFHRSQDRRVDKVFLIVDGKNVYETHNIITDIGEQYDRDILAFQNVTTYNTTSCISLGNTTTVGQTLTKLTTEATTGNFTRNNATSIVGGVTGGDSYYNVTLMWTTTLDMNINSTGLHWSNVSNSDNNMYAVASLGAAYSFPTGSNCTIVWQVIVNDN